MGVGGPMSEEQKNPFPKSPASKPPFSLGDIKKAIPPHCFHRSLVGSFSYLVSDLLLISIMYYVATTYINLVPSPFSYLAWPIYWTCQGCVGIGIWVIAHECGHHAFSDYPWVDDTVGFILHSVLMVPYFSWKYSHRRHHSHANSLDRDEVFVPRPKSHLAWHSKYLKSPIGRFIYLTFIITLGWPLYLAFHLSGRHYDRFASHFHPYSPIYNHRERLPIFLSDAGVLGVGYLLYRIALVKGLAWLVCIYGVPLLMVNAILVLITFLQHTHPSMPYYDSTEWDWLRGTLATCDRDYGMLNKVFHNITDTHVVHHLFPNMPHYHAREATKAVKPLLGDYYHFDGTPVFKAIWREAKECVYIEKEEASQGKGIFWYKNEL